MASLKELSTRPTQFVGGHRLCPGCGEGTIVRQVLMAADKPVIGANATGCLEVSSTIFPFTAWNMPWIHLAFENAAATASGLEAMYKSLKRQGKCEEDVYFVAFGGDGGTYDIGFQALSGAAERGHKFVYVCLNNEAYMNTGIQRSSATPLGAHTTTSPTGKVSPGKLTPRKDLTEIMAAHCIPYVGQSNSGRWRDLTGKAEKAFHADGAAFLNVLSVCPLGWGSEPGKAVEICEVAADTCVWPLYEVVEGQYKITYRPKEKKPIEEYLKYQRRFAHLMRSEQGKAIIAQLQADVDRRWESLQHKAETA
jgi:pyruvate ferredoxin oxidoreductase beta subunit